MKLLQTKIFQNSAKKLHKNQKQSLDRAIQKILNEPTLGSIKKGDLADVQVYKFKMIKQMTLLAYTYSIKDQTIILLVFGTHQNFYRDLKKSK